MFCSETSLNNKVHEPLKEEIEKYLEKLNNTVLSESIRLKRTYIKKKNMHPLESGGVGVPAFLAKLWRLVEDSETNNLISWAQVS